MKLGGSAPLVIAVLAHGANAACLDSCPASPLRVKFVTHGAQADGFWQSMRANAVSAASMFGVSFDPVADWVWYQRKDKQETLDKAIAAAVFLNFLAIMTSAVVALTTTENNSPAAVNSSISRTEVNIQYTPYASLESRSASRSAYCAS